MVKHLYVKWSLLVIAVMMVFSCQSVKTAGKEEPVIEENKGLTVYYVRHAETVANVKYNEGSEATSEDLVTFSELGLRQIDVLTEFLLSEGIQPDIIAVSPAWRTQKTIEPYLKASGRKAEIWVALNEISNGEPSGIPLPTARPARDWMKEVEIVSENIFCLSEEDAYYWWADTYEEGLFMAMTSRDRLLERYSQSGKTILLVGHAVSGNRFVSLLKGYDLMTEEPYISIWLGNTDIVKLEQDPVDGEFQLDTIWENELPYVKHTI